MNEDEPPCDYSKVRRRRKAKAQVIQSTMRIRRLTMVRQMATLQAALQEDLKQLAALVDPNIAVASIIGDEIAVGLLRKAGQAVKQRVLPAAKIKALQDKIKNHQDMIKNLRNQIQDTRKKQQKFNRAKNKVKKAVTKHVVKPFMKGFNRSQRRRAT